MIPYMLASLFFIMDIGEMNLKMLYVLQVYDLLFSESWYRRVGWSWTFIFYQKYFLW